MDAYAPPGEPGTVRVRRDEVAEIIADIQQRLPRWRGHFPSEYSLVEIPRADLVALVDEVIRLRALNPAG